jgi:hypothetical protein
MRRRLPSDQKIIEFTFMSAHALGIPQISQGVVMGVRVQGKF